MQQCTVGNCRQEWISLLGPVLLSKLFIFRLFFEWDVLLILNSASAPSRISLTSITAVRKSVTWKLDLCVVLWTSSTLLLPPAIPENETTYLVDTTETLCDLARIGDIISSTGPQILHLKYKNLRTWFKLRSQT